LGILLSSILCTCPNQCNRFNLLTSVFCNVFHLCAQLPTTGTDPCNTGGEGRIFCPSYLQYGHTNSLCSSFPITNEVTSTSSCIIS
jgi:hypothetical protein